MNKQTITLNGRRYDAVTGNLKPDVSAPKRTVRQARPAVIAVAAKPAAAAVKIASAAGTTTSGSIAITVKRTAHSLPNPADGRQQQASRTLMRKAVKKPAPATKVSRQYPLAHPASDVITVKHSAPQVDLQRLQHAQATSRHPRVSRFDSAAAHTITPVITPLAVQPTPAAATVPVATVSHERASAKAADIFEQAIRTADNYVDIRASGTKRYKQRVRRHIASVAAGSLAIVLLAGFVAYQNTPGLQIRLAGLRAGIATATPDFAASGFAYNGVRSTNAQLVIGLTASRGDSYQLTERTTNWTGDQMIQQVSAIDASGIPNYQTIQARFGSIYRFSGGHATWVKNGRWYQVQGQRALSDEQLINLATNS